LSKRLAVVAQAWVTRRLLWVWLFAYACVITSAFFWTVSPKGSYFECPSVLLPRNAPFPPPSRPARTGWPPLPRDDLAAAPNVRDLIVREPLGMRNWGGLRASAPALEQVFVGDYHDNPAGFREVCQALPGIRVWHLDLNSGRLASTVFLLLATLLLGGAVMQQASATLSLPQARIYPRFVVPHLIVPLAICGAGIAVASFIARRYGTDVWAAASIQALGWGIWSGLEFLSVPLRRNLSRPRIRTGEPGAAAITEVRARWVEAAALILSIAAVYLIFIARPYVLESFLLGELPWFNAGFFVVGAALGAAAVVLAPALAVELNEAGIAPVLSMQDIEKRRTAPILTSPFRGRLGRLRRPPRGPTWWWRIHALQCGNPDLLGSVLIKIVGPIAVVAACEKFLGPQTSLGVFVMLLAGVGWIAALQSCFSIWWQRRKAFSVELLYPWTRRQMALSAFAAYGLDAAGTLALLLIAVIACDITLNWRLGWQLILTAALTALGAATPLVTGGLWLLTLRHRLLASLLALLSVALLVFVFSQIWIVRFWGGVDRVALAWALVAILWGFAAYRRWMRTEWGLFGPS
jgi:hypothetical protein